MSFIIKDKLSPVHIFFSLTYTTLVTNDPHKEEKINTSFKGPSATALSSGKVL